MIKITNDNKLTYEIVKKEIKYSLDKIAEVPNNECPYSYIRGFIKESGHKFSDFAELEENLEKIISPHNSIFDKSNLTFVFSLLLDIYEELNDVQKCENIISTLVEFDYIRKKYWLWRKQKFTSIK